jgi:uncharacterized protein
VAILQEILNLGLQAAPWLLLGLVAAGLIKACVPEALLQRLVGGDGIGAVGRAAVIGAPLPLCSCGAIPTALMLHRNGAGRGPTTAFMVATPGIGADSVMLTYALLGPVMMLARVLGALASAMLTGLLVAAGTEAGRDEAASACARDSSSTGGSCSTGCRGPAVPAAPDPGIGERMRNGLSYAFNDLFDDIGGWVLGGLVVAGLIVWAVPPQAFAAIATGIPAMLLMAVIGIPIYICATAATPIAVAMMLAGASPGTVLVFLLAGPITSMATLAVLQREMGTAAVARYLAGIVATTVLAGFLLDQAIGWSDLDVMATMGAAQDIVPDWLEWGALTVLVLLALRPARRMLLRPA